MKKIFSIIILFGALAFLFGTAPRTLADDSQAQLSQNEKDALQAQIDDKNKQLADIQARKKVIEDQLASTDQSNKQLSAELASINSTVKSLNLSIQENKVTIDKLNIEITSLRGDIISTEDSIRLKKETIGKLFVELQAKPTESLLAIFLKNRNLSESMQETQSIVTLNDQLRQNLTDLNALKGTLTQKVSDQKNKKDAQVAEQTDLTNRQYIVEDQKVEKQTLLTATKNQEKIYQQQLSDLEKLQAQVDAEIEQIGAQLRKEVNSGSLPGRGVLAMPVPGALETQGYGYTAFARTHYSSKYHNGLDFGAPVGTPIYAAESGRVLIAENQDAYCPKGAYGRLVLIKHTNGLTTLYGHMSRSVVSTGDHVDRGELIGYVGKTGFATGAHLHFTVFASNTLPPASGSFPEGTQGSRVCGPMPVGGDLDPSLYLAL